MELIKASERTPKPKQEELSKCFGIGRSTVSDILRKRSQYLDAWESNCTICDGKLGESTLMGTMQHNVTVRATSANSFEGITKGLQHHCNDFGSMDRVHVHGEEVVIYTVYS